MSYGGMVPAMTTLSHAAYSAFWTLEETEQNDEYTILIRGNVLGPLGWKDWTGTGQEYESMDTVNRYVR